MATHSWWHPLLVRACRALLRLAPPQYRARRGQDIVATIGASCLAARRERGRIGLAGTATSELTDLLFSIVRLRTGLTPAVTKSASRQQTHVGSGHARPGRAWIGQDLRLAVRSLVAGRMTTVIVLVTLALGIGINAAVFSVLDSILWRPVPFAEASRLV